MQKISGIIPANHRTRAIDVSNSQPVRPGAPSWGRPTGRVTRNPMPDLADKISQSALDAIGKPDSENFIPQTTYNSRGKMAKSQVVEELAKKFFEPNIKELAREGDETLSEQVENNVKENSLNSRSASQEVTGNVVET